MKNDLQTEIRAEINSQNKEFWYNLGEEFYNSNNYIEAIKKFNRALSLDKKYKEAWNKKGWALNSLKVYHEAIDCFDRALDIDKEYKEAWRGKARAHLNVVLSLILNMCMA